MPKFTVRAATQPGSKHQHLTVNNQDAYVCLELEDGIVVSVCDGAGSRRHSRIGAELAASKAVEFLASIDWTDEVAYGFAQAARNFIRQLQATLHEKAAEMQTEACELACTLIALAVTKRGTRALQIGDGFLVVRDGPENPYRLVFIAQKGEYANETIFVTQKLAAEEMMVFESDQPVDFACLSSDGLERQAIRLAESEPHTPFFDYLVRLARHPEGEEYLQKLLLLPAVDEVTDDDRTLVCILWSDEELPVAMAEDSTPTGGGESGV